MFDLLNIQTETTMQKSVLAEIVRSLGKKEQRELHKWLQSPAHNQREDVPLLFDYLIKNLQQSDSIVEKEDAWMAIFPEKPYDDAYMRQVMYFLLKSLEEYLVFTDVCSNRVTFQNLLTRIYRERKLEKSYKQSKRLTRENLEAQPLRNGFYLYNLFLLELEESIYQVNFKQNTMVNLQETADAFEKWFLAEKFRISCEMMAHHSMYRKAHYDYGLLNSALDFAKDRKFLNEPAVSVFYNTYKAIQNSEEEQYFDEMEDLIQDLKTKFTHSEIRWLYLAALNYCIVKVNQGKTKYARRVFELYHDGIASGVLLDNNIVSPATFGNAIGAALQINEFEWAEQFVHDFEHHLEEKERKNIANFNLARIYFTKGDYDKAQRFLIQFDYDNMVYSIIAKTMLLQIYFEQSDLDAFESLLESMRIYLQRKEALNPTYKAAYKNMISLMKKLLNLNPYSKAQKSKLKELILSTNPLRERDWLLKQVDGR